MISLGNSEGDRKEVPKGVKINTKSFRKLNENAGIFGSGNLPKFTESIKRSKSKDLDSHINNINRQKYLTEVRSKQHLRNTMKCRNFFSNKYNKSYERTNRTNTIGGSALNKFNPYTDGRDSRKERMFMQMRINNTVTDRQHDFKPELNVKALDLKS